MIGTNVITAEERVLLAHGGGGELMQRLLQENILPALANPKRAASGVAHAMTDSAVVPWAGEKVVFTTDSFVVTPLEFPGGDIGRLAVCGTVNDLAVMGATPIALSLGLILGEGLKVSTLERVMQSIARAADEAGVAIVTGDTKVIERVHGAEPTLFINTAGIGRIERPSELDIERVRVGDCILVNGPIAEHGVAVMSVREGLEFETPVRSDAAPLNHLIRRLLERNLDVRFMRDATRGGVAGVLADISDGSELSIEIDERHIPLSSGARQAAEMLGLDPLAVANEGKLVIVVAAEDCDKALRVMREDSLGRNAACIGRITADEPALVELITRSGGRRIVQRPYGEDTPRIC